MRKAFILLLFVPVFCSAQNDTSLPKIIQDTLFTSSGYKIIIGQNVKLGTGTLPYGDFKYIGISQSSWMAGNNNRGQQAVGKNWNGHLFKVKRFRIDGNKKRGYTYYLILGGGNIVNYECDIERAIAVEEIEVPEEYRTKPKPIIVEISNAVSKADEILKLKKLYDDGVLSKDEYETEKKKLLDKKQ